jgi:hypothetical protein
MYLTILKKRTVYEHISSNYSTMKNITVYLSGLLILLGSLTGCDKGFDELNTSKTAPTSLNPVYLLNNAIIRSSFPTSTLVYDESIVQQIVTPNSGVLAGGNFNQDNRDVTRGVWNRYYQEVLKPLMDILAKTQSDAGRANLYQMARIWRAYAAMVLTDTYGDVPFSQAGQGYLEGVPFPQYDTQQSIYEKILTELDEAAAALNASQTIETSDILYAGNVDQWKRLAYSLMLRAGMRLSKVDAAKAQTYVGKAIAGGLMQSNLDNAVVRHTAAFASDLGGTLNGSEKANYYLAAPFVNYLKQNQDPRLASIAVRYAAAVSGGDQDAGKGLTRDTTAQIGMPMGYDNGTIGPVATANGLPSFYAFSQVDRTRMGKQTAPVFMVTLAQTKLLLAEAVFRGWAQGDAAALYREGILAHMDQMKYYDPASAVTPEAAEQYANTHPLEAGKELMLINTQYWVASFLNGPEAFANFRRTGYPVLTPNPYPGRGISGQFIRRLTYPDSELSVNSGRVQEAISRQGTDNLDTRVWWDKP